MPNDSVCTNVTITPCDRTSKDDPLQWLVEMQFGNAAPVNLLVASPQIPDTDAFIGKTLADLNIKYPNA